MKYLVRRCVYWVPVLQIVITLFDLLSYITTSHLVISTAAASEVHAVADCLRLQELGDVQEGGEADGRQDVVIQGPPPGRGQHPASTSVLSCDSISSCGSVSQLVLVFVFHNCFIKQWLSLLFCVCIY